LASENLSIEQQWRLVLDKSTSIELLMHKYPEHWDGVKDQISQALKGDRPDIVSELLTKADATARNWHSRAEAAGESNKARTEALPHLVKSRMIHLAVKKVLDRSIKQDDKIVTQSSFDKMLCNYLFYVPYGQHKAPSALAVKTLWPLVRDKAAAVGAAKKLGFYCLYTDRFIELVKQLSKDQGVLEIAAGSGVLTLLLKKAGLECRATDDLSWGHAVRFGRHVEDLDAAKALKKYSPKIVICSWPPPNNTFEQSVFSSPSVSTYIVIGSKHQFATGARRDYLKQENFAMEVVARPDNFLAPPGLDGEVLLFKRKA
jgi:hypothetical protein